MNEKPRRNRNQPKEPSPATVAARDPKPGAVNRPGFDLGGATGDAKPNDKNSAKRSTAKAHDVATDTLDRMSGKVRSAFAGVRNWLRGK